VPEELDPVELDPVDRCVVGTVGPPGQRTFLLQARQGVTVITVKLEKTQVQALSDYLGKLLQDLARPGHLPDDQELEEPSEPAWVVGALRLGVDDDSRRLVMVLEELVAEDAENSRSLRLGLSLEQAAALAIRGAQLVAAGRPPCPLCGYPLDPAGHACPRTNGNRPPAL